MRSDDKFNVERQIHTCHERRSLCRLVATFLLLQPIGVNRSSSNNSFLNRPIMARTQILVDSWGPRSNKDFGAGSQTNLTRGLVSSAAQAKTASTKQKRELARSSCQEALTKNIESCWTGSKNPKS